jgi:hypothetical protein
VAIRIRSSFHTAGRPRSMAELASVIGIMAWKLAVDSIKRMRQADYDIDIGRSYFDFVCEYMAFLAHAADRIAFRDLTPALRLEFTTALAKRLAEAVEDNRDMLIVDVVPGQSYDHFLDLFNRRGDDYAEHEYTDTGPDFGFRRCFAAGMQEVLPEKDRLWAIDQVMEIESPEAIKALEKTLAGLFNPGPAKSRRSRHGGNAEAGE